MSIPAGSVSSDFLPTNVVLRRDDKSFDYLQDLLTRIAFLLNDKDIGQYTATGIINGQTFRSNTVPSTLLGVYRVVVDTGALPNAATNTVAHGITTTANTYFTRIYGAAKDPATPLWIPLPYVSAVNPVEIFVDATNINIVTTTNMSAYTLSHIVLEWVEDDV